MLRERGQREMQRLPHTITGSDCRSARRGSPWSFTSLLAVRAVLLCLAPLPALVLGSVRQRLLLCAAATVGWLALEVSLVSHGTWASGCKAMPFALRLLGAVSLELAGCWIVAPVGISTGYATVASSELVHPPSLPQSIKMLSVVVPCANESEFVWKTISAIFEATPHDELLEIIVIDDASEPPISEDISAAFLEVHRTTVLRHSSPQGLIRSKKHGGDASKGDAIVFLDCHVKPMEDWTRPILANLRENPRRVVVPAITSLDPDTWEEVSSYGGGTKMCLTWNADFVWCNEYLGPYVPIMSGGLLAMTKYWWDSIGGYDDQMLSWGGENLDQSLRTWLCGGEIMVAQGSRVAHMWRDPAKPKTMLRYAIPTDHVRRNRLRAAQAWLGEWVQKVRSFPEFEDFGENGPLEIGSLANVERYRNRLQCKGFDWYLHRFQDLYTGTGRLPMSVFHLQDALTGLCLHYEVPVGESDSGRIVMAPCNRESEVQRFHTANAKAGTNECCSGLKVWDFNACGSAYELGGVLHADPCEMAGDAPGQHLRMTPDGLIVWEAGQSEMEQGCLSPMDRSSEGVAVSHGAALRVGTGCAARVELVGTSEERQRFRVVSGSLCLSSHGAEDNGEQLSFVPCEEGGEDLWFMRTHAFSDDRHQVVTSKGLCVDAKHGEGPVIVWPCDPVEFNNPNQIYAVDNGTAFIWRAGMAGTSCIDVASTVALAHCAAPSGGVPTNQLFQKRNIHEDGTFELHQGGSGFCLGYLAREGLEEDGGDRIMVYSIPCSGAVSQRWVNDGGRLRNVELDLCMDANDMLSPILYSCYSLGELPAMQHFKLYDNGWVFLPRSWADNGRKRYPAKCLDSRPAPGMDVVPQNCDEVKQRGAKWVKLWEEIPLETRLFMDAEARRNKEDETSEDIR